MSKYKKILNDEIGGYHKQVTKMKATDTIAMEKTRRRRRAF